MKTFHFRLFARGYSVPTAFIRLGKAQDETRYIAGCCYSRRCAGSEVHGKYTPRNQVLVVHRYSFLYLDHVPWCKTGDATRTHVRHSSTSNAAYEKGAWMLDKASFI